MNRLYTQPTQSSACRPEHASSPPKGLLLRLIAYCVLPTACIFAFTQITIISSDSHIVFRENMIVEWCQVIVLFAAVLCLIKAQRLHPSFKNAFFILMLLPLMAVSRELDSFFEMLVADNFWKIPAGGLIFYMLYYIRRHSTGLKDQLRTIIASRSFMLMVAGCFFVLGFSRLMGQKSFWQSIMQENYVRMAARTFEESSEFAGYCIILAGAFEFLYEQFTAQPATLHSEPVYRHTRSR